MAAHKKSARRRGALICFQDESGFSLLPVVRATARRQVEGIVVKPFTWQAISQLAEELDVAMPKAG